MHKVRLSLNCREILACEKRQTEDSQYSIQRTWRIFIWIRESWLNRKWIFLYCFECHQNFKRIFLEIMFLKLSLYKTFILIIRWTWNVICMFELSVVTAWDFITRIVFLIYNEKAEISAKKKLFFFSFSTPSFSEKLLFFFFSSAVKPLLIVKNFDFFGLALLENKFCTTAETLKISIPLYYTVDIRQIIFKQ